jgi:hypothetical protein
MMAGYLVIRFVVMTAPVWATLAIVSNLQGTLRSALSVVAAAVVHPAVMAVGAPVSVLTTGYLLNPDTGLGWLGLLLSVLFTAMMWTVLKPYRRLTSLVTGEPVETPGATLARLRAQAGSPARVTGLDQATAGVRAAAAGGLTTAVTATAITTARTTVNPPPGPGTVQFRPTRPDHTPTWAREDDHDHEYDDEGGPQWPPMAARQDFDQDPRVDVPPIYTVTAAGAQRPRRTAPGDGIESGRSRRPGPRFGYR